MLDRVARFFCSLRLTVVLLGAALVLVFVGTMAQVHEGLFVAQVRYFKSWYIWKPTIGDNQWPIVLPGGYLIGSMLLLNLVAAHVKRFKFTTQKIGIQLIHGGIILLLLGQLLTDALSQESSMRLFEGTSSNYSEDFRANELVLIDTSNPTSDLVVSIAEAEVARKGVIQHAALPVTIRVKEYWQNCDVEPPLPAEAQPVAAGRGLFTNMSVVALADSAPPSEQTRAAAFVEIITDHGSLGSYLVPGHAESDQIFTVGGKDWVLSFTFAPMVGGNLLAVSRAGDMGGASMVTFSESDLRPNGELKNEKLPFTFRVKNYWAKCELYHRPSANSVQPPVTEGLLAGSFILPKPLVTDADHRNVPAAVVELLNAKGALGTWLLSAGPDVSPESFELGGRSYTMAFQFERYYKPYSIGLKKFNHDQYKGTSIPSNFSSRIRLVNPQNHEDREVVIKMNSPLRYAGTTYYQAGFDERRPNVTILEVVTNPGWLTPYLACLIVGAGLLIQFMGHLVRFVTARKAV